MEKKNTLVYLGYIVSSLGGVLTIFSASSIEADSRGLYLAASAVLLTGLGLWMIYVGSKA